jgi:hypothetical protein
MPRALAAITRRARRPKILSKDMGLALEVARAGVPADDRRAGARNLSRATLDREAASVRRSTAEMTPLVRIRSARRRARTDPKSGLTFVACREFGVWSSAAARRKCSTCRAIARARASPENTLPAFATALSLGVVTLELDVGDHEGRRRRRQPRSVS